MVHAKVGNIDRWDISKWEDILALEKHENMKLEPQTWENEITPEELEYTNIQETSKIHEQIGKLKQGHAYDGLTLEKHENI